MSNIFKRWFTSPKEQATDDSLNPWAGLASYEDPETAERQLKFCGRGDESYDLARLIMGNVFVTLYGKSGIGKTSLLNAGVFPELREEQFTPVSLRLGLRDKEHHQSYQTMLIEAVERVVKRKEMVSVVDEQEDQKAIDYLWNYFVRHRFYDKNDESTTPVVILDQFEEVFRGDPDGAETLLRQLDYLNDKDHALDSCTVDGQPYRYEQNFRFVISIREDDLYRLEDSIDNCYLPALKRCRYRLRSLSEQGAHDAILIPGEGKFLPEKQEDIANAIIDKSRNDDGSISTNIISLLCSRIYEELKKSGASHITPALVDSFLKGNPFERFYDEATSELSNKEKSYIEKNLVDSAGRRNSVSESDFLKSIPKGKELLEGKKHILQLISTSDGSNRRVELIHDQLAEVLSRKTKKRISKRVRIWTTVAVVAAILLLLMYAVHLGTSVSTFDSQRLSSNNEKYRIADEVIVDSVRYFGRSFCSTIRIQKDTPLTLTSMEHPRVKDIFIEHQSIDQDLILDSICATIHLSKELKHLNVNTGSTKSYLQFEIPEENKAFLWQDEILWNLADKSIEYTNWHQNQFVEIPQSFGLDSVRYNELTFYAITPKNYEDSYYFWGSDEDTITKEVARKHLAHKIEFRSGVKRIEEEAFAGLDKLEEVVFDGDAIYVERRAFANCPNLKKVTINCTLNGNFDCDWKDNIFSESHNIQFDTKDTHYYMDNNGAVLWHDSIPAFFSHNSKNNDSITFKKFVPANPPKNEKDENNYEFKDGVFCDFVNHVVFVRTNAEDISLSNRPAVSTVYIPPGTNKLKRIHLKKDQYFKFDISDVLKKRITILVPNNALNVYKETGMYADFKSIEGDTYLSQYIDSADRIIDLIKSFFSAYPALPAGLVALFLLILWALYILTTFSLNKKGNKQPGVWKKVLLSTILYSFLWLVAYTAFYWLSVFKFHFNIGQANLIAIPLSIAVIALLLYLRYVAGDWDLFKEKIKGIAWQTWKSFISFTKKAGKFLLHHWKRIAAVALIAFAIWMLIGSLKSCKDHQDLNKMIDERNWDAVIEIVYDRLMDNDSIDDITRSWARTLLLKASQDTLTDSILYKERASVYLYDKDIDGENQSSSYVLGKIDGDNEHAFICDAYTGTTHYSDSTNGNVKVSDSYFVYQTKNGLHIEYLKENKPAKDIPLIVDYATIVLLPHSIVQYSFHDSLMIYNTKTEKKYCLNSGYPKFNNDINKVTWVSPTKKEIYWYDDALDSIKKVVLPENYAFSWYLRWRSNKHLGFYLDNEEGESRDTLYDISSNTFCDVNTFTFGDNYYFSNHNDTTFLYSKGTGDSYLEHKIPFKIDTDKMFCSNNYSVFKKVSTDDIYYNFYPTNALSIVDKGDINAMNDSVLIVSHNDSISIYRIGAERPEIVRKFEGRYNYSNDMLTPSRFWAMGYYTEEKDGYLSVYSPKGDSLIAIDSQRFNNKIENVNKKLEGHYYVEYRKGDSHIELHPLDGTPYTSPIIVKTKNIINNETEVYIVNNIIIIKNKSSYSNVEIFRIPTLEEAINRNQYLSDRQKNKLIQKISK